MTSNASFALKAICVLACFSVGIAAGSRAIAQSSRPAANAASTPQDAAEVAQAIQASYYHPDRLGGLDCDVSIDWRALFQGLKMDPPEDRLKALEALRAHVRAPRGNRAEVTYKWAGEVPTTSDQITTGMQQMLGGFFQMYWPMIASSIVSKASDITRVEPDAGGGREVFSISPGSSVVLTIDDQSTPTHFSFDSPALKGTFDLQYTPAPNPVPGDLRRITSLKADEQIGSSELHLIVGLDYQKLETWNIPHHVTLNVVGAYSIAFELTGCSALPMGA